MSTVNTDFTVWFAFVCLFYCFTSQLNSYGHCGTVSSLYHTFFLGKLEQAVNQYFVHILSLVTDNIMVCASVFFYPVTQHTVHLLQVQLQKKRAFGPWVAHLRMAVYLKVKL